MAKKPRILTDEFITALKPAPKGQRESYADVVVPGLKVRVTDRGAKSFILWRRFPPSKNPAARSLGAVGTITLTAARDKARRWLEIISQGKDPRTVERNEREAEQGRDGITFGEVFEKYLASHVKRMRKAADIEREMRKDLLSRWKDKLLREITRRDVVRMIDEVSATS